MKKKWMIIIISLVIILVGGFVFFQTSKMEITTVPISAEVWLDGSCLGDSPLIINILDFRTHTLELKYERSMDVVYEFTRFTMLRKVNIISSSTNGFTDQNYTADQVWKLETGYDGVFLVNRNDPEQRKPIIEYEVEEDPINLLAPPARVSISPDGKYAMMVSWIKGSDAAEPAFWFVPVGKQEKYIEVFSDFREEINDAAVTRILDMGFSPDSKWIWITTNDHFAIASIEHPDNPVIVFNDIVFSWSADGQWLAIGTINKDPNLSRVFHNTSGEWDLYLDDILGSPIGFSNDACYLWTFSLYIPPGAYEKTFYSPVQLTDLQTNLVISEISTQNTIRGISTPVESQKGDLFAFVYKEAFSQNHVKMLELSQDPNRGNLMITDEKGKLVNIITDEDYSSVAYWLPDGKHLAAVVHGESGYYIKIVDVNEK